VVPQDLKLSWQINTIKPSLVFTCIKFELIDKSLPRCFVSFITVGVMNDHVLLICTYVNICMSFSVMLHPLVGTMGARSVKSGSPCYHSRFGTLFVMMDEAKKVFMTLVLN
jgi:hypothetical protein